MLGTHATRLIMTGAFDRHPKLKVVLGHLGEALPFWMSRLDNRYAWTYKAAGENLGMARLELTPSEYLRRNFLVTTSGMDDPGALAFCVERLGEDNLMFAIDFPYEDSLQATAFFREADLSDSQEGQGQPRQRRTPIPHPARASTLAWDDRRAPAPTGRKPEHRFGSSCAKPPIACRSRTAA